MYRKNPLILAFPEQSRGEGCANLLVLARPPEPWRRRVLVVVLGPLSRDVFWIAALLQRPPHSHKHWSSTGKDKWRRIVAECNAVQR